MFKFITLFLEEHFQKNTRLSFAKNLRTNLEHCQPYQEKDL